MPTTTDTDTDRVILEALDHEPDCNNCDRPAAWYLAIHTVPCGCPDDALLCTPCLEKFQERITETRAWKCHSCKTVLGLAPGTKFTKVDRLEAL